MEDDSTTSDGIITRRVEDNGRTEWEAETEKGGEQWGYDRGEKSGTRINTRLVHFWLFN